MVANKHPNTMLIKAALFLASCLLAVAAAAPLAQPDDLSVKQFIDNPRFGGRAAVPIEARDETDSVRITGGGEETDSVRITGGYYLEAARIKRDDADSVQITEAGQGGPNAGQDWTKIKRGPDDGPEKETDWGKVKRRDGGEDGPQGGSEWTR